MKNQFNLLKCYKCGDPIKNLNLYIEVNNKKLYFHIDCISCDELQLFLTMDKQPKNNNKIGTFDLPFNKSTINQIPLSIN